MRRKVVFVGVGIFASLCIITIAGMAFAYKNTFYPGTKVGGIALGGLTHDEGVTRVRTAIAAYRAEKVIVAVPDLTKPREDATGRYPDVTAQTTVGELGVDFSPDAALSESWSTGHTYTQNWFSDAYNSLVKGNAQPLAYTIDQKAVSAFIETTLNQEVPTPKPATLKITGGDVVVTDPADGLVIDDTALGKLLATRLTTAPDGSDIYVRAEASLAPAPIGKATIQPYADRLNAIGDTPITLKAASVSLKPDRATKLSWFSMLQADDGTLSLALQEDKVTDYVTTKGGGAVDVQKSATAAVSALSPLATASGTDPVTVALVTSSQKTTTPTTYTLGEYPGKYVEVYLADQKMYRIEGNTLQATYTVSSGKWSTPTPTGTFTLSGHIKRAWSRSFGLWMPDWVNFKDNQYGIHALPEWPNGYKEGEAHLGTPVSHGCIRLSDADAEVMYDWIEDGTPLIIR
jgi:lipoprotein-anchoring transpeptidase ErfK/SrfK